MWWWVVSASISMILGDTLKKLHFMILYNDYSWTLWLWWLPYLYFVDYRSSSTGGLPIAATILTFLLDETGLFISKTKWLLHSCVNLLIDWIFDKQCVLLTEKVQNSMYNVVFLAVGNALVIGSYVLQTTAHISAVAREVVYMLMNQKRGQS